MYLSAPANVYFRPSISIEAGACEVRLDVRDDFFHAAHAVHGSVYFKLLDDATFFAVASEVDDVFVALVLLRHGYLACGSWHVARPAWWFMSAPGAWRAAIAS